MSLNERNDVLNKKINESDLPDVVAVLAKDAHRRRRQVFALTISLILDFILTAGMTFLSVQTHSVAAQAENNQQALVRSCETTNAARANNKQLWDYILNLPSENPRISSEQLQIDKFKTFVDKTFAPRDCSKVVEN